MQTSNVVESSENLQTVVLIESADGPALEGARIISYDEEPSQKRKIKRPRGIKWSDDEIRVLFLSKKNRNVNLRNATRRHPIFRELSNDMMMYGYTRSSCEISQKVDNMYNQYRREKEKFEQTGVPPKWKFYEIMKRIIELDKAADPLPNLDEIYSDMEISPTYTVNGEESVSQSAHIIKLSKSVPKCTVSDADTPNSSQTHSKTSSVNSEVNKGYITKQNIILPKHCVISQEESDEVEEPVVSNLPNGLPRKRKRDTYDLLEGLLKEFRRANSQNEKFDRELVNLLHEGNELCRKQNELLTQLVNK